MGVGTIDIDPSEEGEDEEDGDGDDDDCGGLCIPGLGLILTAFYARCAHPCANTCAHIFRLPSSGVV